MQVASVNFVNFLDGKVLNFHKVRDLIGELQDELGLSDRHSHNLPNDQIYLLMFFEILLDKSYKFDLKHLLLIVAVTLEDGEIGLRTFDDKFLQKFQIVDQRFLYLLDFDDLLRFDRVLVLVLYQVEELLDDLAVGVVLGFELFGQRYLFSYHRDHLLKQAALVLLVFDLTQAVIDLLVHALLEFHY